MSFWLGVVVSVVLFAIAGLAGGWLEARLRLLSVAHAAIIGTGAYAFTLSTSRGLSPALGFLLAMVCGILLGVSLVVASQRVVRDDFALFTFAFQVAWFGLVANARPWTGGALGLSGVEHLPLMGGFGRTEGALLWSLAVLTVCGVVLRAERRGPFPVAAAVLARSAELADSLGLGSRLIRLQIGGLHGLALGAVGAVLASYLSFIAPGIFAVSVSVVVIGIGFLASWRWWGAALGAVVLIGLPEGLRAAGLASASTAFLRQILAGCIVAASALLILTRRRS